MPYGAVVVNYFALPVEDPRDLLGWPTSLWRVDDLTRPVRHARIADR
jgi:hypothetical protein